MSPPIRMISESDEVGPGDDEAVAAHRAGGGLAGDVGLGVRWG